ncbi:MAG: TetR/AcrR family transcriptional regulator [Desulfamplus sp.]|nr:TetR/AcrR family transcriptional regulator [Desulfamplus sp.]
MKATHKRNQAERSSQTQIKLFDATLNCLQEFGYHGASLSQILKKAGVSRGAWSHHFENKLDLIAAAAEYVLNSAIETTRDWALSSGTSELSLSEIFDFIWENFYTGRHRDVWLEFNVACRTDEQLRERLEPVLAHFHASMAIAWQTYFTAKACCDSNIQTIMILTINTFRGMAIQSITQNDPHYFKQLRMEWFKIVSMLVEPKQA